MNPDAIANHFYEQGKADAMKTVLLKLKILIWIREGLMRKSTMPGGITVRSLKSSSSKFGIRKK